MTEYIRVVCNKLNSICTTKATRIPILPPVVTFDTVSDCIGKLDTIPVGIEKEYLLTSTIDLNKISGYIITGEDIDSNLVFIQGLV